MGTLPPYSNGREKPLKRATVWVRIPPGVRSRDVPGHRSRGTSCRPRTDTYNEFFELLVGRERHSPRLLRH